MTDDGDVKEIVCVVKNVDEPITLYDSIRYYVISAIADGKEIKLYFDEVFDVGAFVDGVTVRFRVADNNYVIAYEVIKNGH